MGRLNAFVEAGNDHRSTGVGGRRGNSNGAWAWLNTDTQEGEVDVKVEANVYGEGRTVKERRATGGDRREACFFFTLPKKTKSSKTRVDLNRDGRLPWPTIVGGCDLAGAVERPTITNAQDVLGELQVLFQDALPCVTLPGGITLAHALACVEFVARLGLPVVSHAPDASRLAPRRRVIRRSKDE